MGRIINLTKHFLVFVSESDTGEFTYTTIKQSGVLLRVDYQPAVYNAGELLFGDTRIFKIKRKRFNGAQLRHSFYNEEIRHIYENRNEESVYDTAIVSMLCLKEFTEEQIIEYLKNTLNVHVDHVAPILLSPANIINPETEQDPNIKAVYDKYLQGLYQHKLAEIQKKYPHQTLEVSAAYAQRYIDNLSIKIMKYIPVIG